MAFLYLLPFLPFGRYQIILLGLVTTLRIISRSQTCVFVVKCRLGGGRRQSNVTVPREYSSANRHVDTARPALRSDPQNGAARPARWYMETTRLRRLGSPPGRKPIIIILISIVVPYIHSHICFPYPTYNM